MKNLLLNSAYHLGAAYLLRRGKQHRLTVLSIHRISDQRDPFWNPITPTAFNSLLIYVKKHYNVIGFNQLQDVQPSKKPLLILSFDDGYYDFYEFALPLLKKHHLTCNHNIVNDCANNGTTIWAQRLNTIFGHCKQHAVPLDVEFGDELLNLTKFNNNWMAFYLATFKKLLNETRQFRTQLLHGLESRLSINSSFRMMNWNEIRECAANGVEIGNHTYNHDALSTISDRKVLEHEIITSKLEMEKELGKTVNVLALPNGQTENLADEVISASDHTYVLYVDDALNTLPLEKNTHLPVKISRINLVDEPFPQIILRAEQFHSVMRKYV
ncbi:MAG: polysaccharide deacetylase family protein [Flavobacteriales bacterium]|nr:polysaccharide deacetylase family protein [Flavobacteriales bacterium]